MGQGILVLFSLASAQGRAVAEAAKRRATTSLPDRRPHEAPVARRHPAPPGTPRPEPSQVFGLVQADESASSSAKKRARTQL